MVAVTVNEQPFADAPVSVSAAEPVTVTTDAQGRFEVLPLEFGSWEELTSPDGVDVVVEFDSGTGAVEVAIQLRDGTADPATPLTPVTTRAFDVEADGETLAGRIAQDYRDASLSADDAARYSLLSAVDCEYRAAPYVDLYDDDVPEDPQALGLFAATLYDEVSDETRAERDE